MTLENFWCFFGKSKNRAIKWIRNWISFGFLKVKSFFWCLNDDEELFPDFKDWWKERGQEERKQLDGKKLPNDLDRRVKNFPWIKSHDFFAKVSILKEGKWKCVKENLRQWHDVQYLINFYCHFKRLSANLMSNSHWQIFKKNLISYK